MFRAERNRLPRTPKPSTVVNSKAEPPLPITANSNEADAGRRSALDAGAARFFLEKLNANLNKLDRLETFVVAGCRLVTLGTNPPRIWDEDAVRQYHEIVTGLETLGDDLSFARIPNKMLKSGPSAILRAPRSGRLPGSVQVSAKRTCNEQYMRQQIESIVLHSLNREKPFPEGDSNHEGSVPSSREVTEPTAYNIIRLEATLTPGGLEVAIMPCAGWNAPQPSTANSKAEPPLSITVTSNEAGGASRSALHGAGKSLMEQLNKCLNMITSLRRFTIASTRLELLGTNPPHVWDEDAVRQFHDILTGLEASGIDLSFYRIPNEMLKVDPAAILRAPRSGPFPNSVQMSAKRTCDEQYMRQQIDTLNLYLRSLAKNPFPEGDSRREASVPPSRDVTERSASQARRSGFPANMERHKAISKIVSIHAPNWRHRAASWKGTEVLKLICADLDKAQNADESGLYDIPEGWRLGSTESLRNTPAKGWSDALQLAPAKVITDQIRYSLKMFRRYELSESHCDPVEK